MSDYYRVSDNLFAPRLNMPTAMFEEQRRKDCYLDICPLGPFVTRIVTVTWFTGWLAKQLDSADWISVYPVSPRCPCGRACAEGGIASVRCAWSLEI